MLDLVQRIRCRFGYHRRSRSQASLGPDRVWRSRCRGCGTPMRWDSASETWRLAEGETSTHHERRATA